MAVGEAKKKATCGVGRDQGIRLQFATRTFLQVVSWLENGFGALSVRNADPDKYFEELLNSTIRSSGKKTRGAKAIAIFLAEVNEVVKKSLHGNCAEMQKALGSAGCFSYHTIQC